MSPLSTFQPRTVRFARRAAALLLALAGTCSVALAQDSAPVATTPPPAPASPAAPAPQAGTSTYSVWSMSTTSDDGRTVRIEGKNGAISAEVDGKQIPADRIVHEGSSIRINDDKGQSIFEGEIPGSDSSVHIYSSDSFSGGPNAFSTIISPRARIGRGMGGLSALPNHAAYFTEPPKVMIGVQLLDPDSSIRGHLGLKEDESTMISATYEGLPAAQAGLEPYDIIVSINGKSPAPPAVVRKELREVEAGKTVSMEVIHRGQKKTITVTPEKFNEQKLEKAKVNAIAAAANVPGGTAIAGAMNDDMTRAWAQGSAGAPAPMIATIPGQPGKSITFWHNGVGDAGNEELARRMEELAARAQQQAERAQDQAERLSQGLGAGSPADINKLMEERMKKMEELLQKLMEQQNNAKPAESGKDSGKS